MKSLVLFFSALALASANPITVVSQTGNNAASYPLGYYAPYGATNNPGAGAVSWTQTSTFTDVNIYASIWQVNGYAPGITNVYLVSAIGSGASFQTTGVAKATIATLPNTPGLSLVLSLSTLGPGTYYLVIDSTAVSSSWTYAFQAPATLSTASGVTFGGNYGARGSSVDTSYSPASNFFAFNPGIVPFGFAITAGASDTSATPEPSTLLLSSLALLILRFRRPTALG